MIDASIESLSLCVLLNILVYFDISDSTTPHQSSTNSSMKSPHIFGMYVTPLDHKIINQTEFSSEDTNKDLHELEDGVPGGSALFLLKAWG